MAKLEDLKPGDILEADGGFTCLEDGEICYVYRDGRGLFIKCEDGHHYLSGQVGDDGHLVGLTNVTPTKAAGRDQTAGV